MSGCVIYVFLEKKMVELLANSEDPDQTLHSAASVLALHCLPITLLRFSRLQWVKYWDTLSTYMYHTCPKI